MNVRATDSNGVSAFLQVIAVSSGQADIGAAPITNGGSETQGKPVVLWLPTVILLLLLLPAYWLGRRSQLVTIRNKMIKERDRYQDKK